jgi:hypothetical protein
LFQRLRCGFDVEDELGQSAMRIASAEAIASAKRPSPLKPALAQFPFFVLPRLR